MNISDRKELYLSYNCVRYERLHKKLQVDQKNAIHVLPLLLHVNINLLPGYISSQTPFGISGYVPDEKAIYAVSKLNNQISINTEVVSESCDIEAVYMQEDVATNKLILWVLHDESMESSKVGLLRQKVKILIGWLRKTSLDVECRISAPDSISNVYYGSAAGAFKPDKSFFLDKFYAETIVLAGKCPAWWLLPPGQERIYSSYIEELNQTHENYSSEIIDFGSLSLLRPQDYLSAALWYLYNANVAPESSWLNLLLLRHRFMSFPVIDNIATRLKSSLYDNHDDLAGVDEQNIFIGLINEDLNSGATLYDESLNALLVTISSYWAQHSKRLISHSIFTQLLLWRTNFDNSGYVINTDVASFVSSRKVLLRLITETYNWIVARAYEQDKFLIDQFRSIQLVSDNLLSHIYRVENQSPILNTRMIQLYRLDKICLVESVNKDKLISWMLVVPLEAEKQLEIHVSDSIVNVLVWAWVNHLIDTGTQISVRSESKRIRQTEANNLLDHIIQNIPKDFTRQALLEDFTGPERRIRSFVYICIDEECINYSEQISADNVSHCSVEIDCIGLSSWGDVQYQHLSGLDALVFYMTACLNELPLSDRNGSRGLTIESLKPGQSKYVSLEIRDVYESLHNYLLDKRHFNGEYIFRCMGRYYLISTLNKQFECKVIGDLELLYKYFEKRPSFSRRLVLDLSSFSNSPLLEVFRQNKQDKIQLFYVVRYGLVDVYISDENNSLYHHTQPYIDHRSFINQWVDFFINTQDHLNAMGSVNRRLSNIQIGRLILDHTNHYKYIEEDIHDPSKYGNYFNLRVIIDGKKNNRALTLLCDDRSFSSINYGDNIFKKLMGYVSEKRKNSGDLPVYLTDIEAPLELFESNENTDVNVQSYLKYKINIENRLSVLSKSIREH